MCEKESFDLILAKKQADEEYLYSMPLSFKQFMKFNNLQSWLRHLRTCPCHHQGHQPPPQQASQLPWQLGRQLSAVRMIMR